MKKLKKILIWFFLIICVIAILLLRHQLPDQVATKGTNFDNIEHQTLRSNITYIQKIKVKVNDAQFINTKLLIPEKTDGTLSFEIYDEHKSLLNQGTYQLSNLPKDNNLQLYFLRKIKNQGVYYLVLKPTYQSGKIQVLTTANYPDKYLINDQKQKRTIVYYVNGYLPDPTYYWLPIFGIVAAIMLLVAARKE